MTLYQFIIYFIINLLFIILLPAMNIQLEKQDQNKNLVTNSPNYLPMITKFIIS